MADINARVERLGPVLDDRQKDRYRSHLFHNTLLPGFGIKPPTPE